LGQAPGEDVLNGWWGELTRKADMERTTANNRAGFKKIRRLFLSALHFASTHADLLTLLLLICFLYVYLRLFQNALIDDAFITLNYVKNIVRNGTWGFFAGHVANTATSPLNVILLTIVSLLTGSITESPIWLALFCFVVMAIALDRISSKLFGRKWFGRLATLALVLNPLIISTIGLESIVFSALLVLSLYCVVSGKWCWLAFVLGMLSITRVDGLLFAAIFLFSVPTFRTRLRFLGILLLSAAPWYLFSWIHLGSFVPDTLFIRLTEPSWPGSTFANGAALYFWRYPTEAYLSFAYLSFLPALLIRQVRNSPVVRLVLALGFVHFLAYSLLPVAPFHWYYVPESVVAALFGAVSMGIIYKLCRPGTWQRMAVSAVLSISVLVALIGMYSLLARDHFRVTEVPIHTNVASEQQYKQVGLWLKDNVAGNSVFMEGEIGTLAYYCDCFLLDSFSDRRWLAPGVNKVIAGHGLGAAIYRLNFLFLRDDPGFPPYAYILTVRGDRSETAASYVHKWETSTKWTPEGRILLSRY
jgi:hypothetical protein